MQRNTITIGKIGEDTTVNYLKQNGYRILARNWRTRRCEIDIVALKDSAVYFIEVKFRSKSSQGNGLDYITPSKRRQMKFAADVWVARNNWQGAYFLSAVAVDGRLNKIEMVEAI
jgi:Holliday junction resolvase-like predicted endonuclease